MEEIREYSLQESSQKKIVARHSASIVRAGLSGWEMLYLLVWPFGAMVKALKNFRYPASRTLFWLFCIYFGFVFIYADPFGKGGADSARYAAKLIRLHDNPPSFGALAASFYNADDGVVDIYEPLTTWMVSMFTGDPRWLFALFGLVFGFFYSRNLWIVFNTIQRNVGVVLLTLMMAYAMVNPIWNINGVRMWTAAQVYIFGALNYFMLNKRSGIGWIAASVLFHFSFLFPAALFFSWLIVPKRATLLFGFYFTAALIIEIDLVEVRNLLSFLPDVFQPRVRSYTNEAYAVRVAESAQQMAWHVIWSGRVFRWATYAWITTLFFTRKKWGKFLPGAFMLFLFALFLGGFANIAALVPSGGRFTTVSMLLFYATFVILMGSQVIHFKVGLIQKITLPMLLFNIVFKIRMGFDYIGILLFLGNPLVSLLVIDQTPLIDFVKQMFQ